MENHVENMMEIWYLFVSSINLNTVSSSLHIDLMFLFAAIFQLFSLAEAAAVDV